jgi:DNA-binding CsgD family transcriptional regulator
MTQEPAGAGAPRESQIAAAAVLGRLGQPGQRPVWDAAELIYVYVSAHRPTFDEVRNKAGVDDPDVLARLWRLLQDMELIRPIGDERFDAVDPDAALATTLDRHLQEMAQTQEKARALAESMEALAEVFRPAAARMKAAITVERYDARGDRDTALLDLNAAARESTDSLHPGPMPTDITVLERSAEVDAKMVARGIRVRAIYPQSLLQTPRYAKYLRDLVAKGIDVRLIDHSPHDLLIFDRHTVFLPGDPDDHSKTMIKVTGPLVKTYVAAYEDFWRRAISVHMLLGDAVTLDPPERSIMTMMLQGVGDDQIARTLGIHRRTLQRRVTLLMERVGAKTRIELGFRLGQGRSDDALLCPAHE